jgi:hypothetical protein
MRPCKKYMEQHFPDKQNYASLSSLLSSTVQPREFTSRVTNLAGERTTAIRFFSSYPSQRYRLAVYILYYIQYHSTMQAKNRSLHLKSATTSRAWPLPGAFLIPPALLVAAELHAWQIFEILYFS